MTGTALVARALRSSLAVPTAAGLAVLCTSTALSGVLGGVAWLAYAALVVAMVVGIGVGLRMTRIPVFLVPIGQLAGVLGLSVGLFTHSGVLAVLPGPAALHELITKLHDAVSLIRNTAPPVTATTSVLAMIVMSFGVVTVAVDALTTIARAPAAAGLVLLCVYAVPASLAGTILPWWSFVASVGSFAFVLLLGGLAPPEQRLGRGARMANVSARAAPAAIGVAAVAIILALLVGSTVTAVGTGGRGNGTSADTSYLGIKPFVALRTMLNTTTTTDLFNVRGLPANGPYLRALTVSDYRPGTGWFPDSVMAAGVPTDGPLPAPPGAAAVGSTTDLDIQPVRWDDVWLPIFGVPRQLRLTSGGYHYDQDAGVIYSVRPQHPGPYGERASLTEPTADQLRAAGSNFEEIDQKYSHADQIDPSLTRLAENLTAHATTEFDRALAIYRYFRNPANGFRYNTQVAPVTSGDPVVDFVFHSKTGYCEQYASAMGVLLRAIGVPVRIGIGFTDGTPSGDLETITSHDAHAWAEVFFPGFGWITFDPTPLTDGRTHVPTYLAGMDDSDPAGGAAAQNDSTSGTDAGTTGAASANSTAGADNLAGSTTSYWRWWTVGALTGLAIVFTVLARAGSTRGKPHTRPRSHAMLSGRWHRRWIALAVVTWLLAAFFTVTAVSWWLAALVMVLVAAAAPASVREYRRRRRSRTIMERGPWAADAAWAEILAESRDRGATVSDSETVRLAARRLIREHSLDDQGRDSLMSLVSSVERSWYGPADAQPDSVLPGAFDQVTRSLRRNAPLALRARLLPRSVLSPQPGGSPSPRR